MKQFLNLFRKKIRKNKKKKQTKNSRVKGKKRFKKVIISLIVITIFGLLSMLTYYFYSMSSVSNNKELKEVTINEGSIESVAKTLKREHLIRNITMFKVYIKLSGKHNLKAGIYELSESMSTKKIVNKLLEGSKINPNQISITFKEGINVRDFARIISDKTSNNYDDIMNTLLDNTYIDTLISKYWFLTDDIKNKDIYYPLEGYLYPDTYLFNNKEVSINEIVTKVLDETENKLSKLKSDIENNKYSIHEIITLSSVVELEVANPNDRKDVAGVFLNRLNSNSGYSLGSDASSYYGAKIDDWRNVPLTYKELNDCSNKYNTRCTSKVGLPVGPICNPSIESVTAVLHPNNHNYYYFVNDCSGKLYLSENEKVHINTINKLKREDNWCA